MLSAKSGKGLGGLDFCDEHEGGEEQKKEAAAEEHGVETEQETLPTFTEFHDKWVYTHASLRFPLLSGVPF